LLSRSRSVRKLLCFHYLITHDVSDDFDDSNVQYLEPPHDTGAELFPYAVTEDQESDNATSHCSSSVSETSRDRPIETAINSTAVGNSVAPGRMDANYVQSESQPQKQLFALIIGINDYDHITPKLCGAVADANAIEEYLQRDLRVPSSNITKLLDKEATRAQIIDELKKLSTNANIEPGNPIVIYYAGHGAEAKASWVDKGQKIQCILPVDVCSSPAEGSTNIKGISGRTIGILLNQITQQKSNNITVILDSCHSATGTRAVQSRMQPRGVAVSFVFLQSDDEDDNDILPSLEAVSQARALQAQPEPEAPFADFYHIGLNSHVLLAACGKKESAWEDKSKRRGLFTQALLKVLQSAGPTLTYSNLIARLDEIPPSQNPHCVGNNKDRILFEGVHRELPLAGLTRVCYDAKTSHWELKIDAGDAHGITEGAKFSLYNDRNPSSNPLLTLVAKKTLAFSTILCPDSDATHSSFSFETGVVRQTHAGIGEGLRLFVADQSLASNAVSTWGLQERDGGKRRIEFVGTGKDAKVVLDADASDRADKVVFDVSDLKGDMRRFYKTAKPTADDVYAVIKEAAHYCYHLYRVPTIPILRKKVQISLFRLQEKPGVAKDSEGLDPSLVRGQGPLYINYGGSSGEPQTFYLRKGQMSAVGFLKIFLSTRPLDLSHISTQAARAGGTLKLDNSNAEGHWDAVTITVNILNEPTQPT
ncbi:hypothetical protein PHLCEN_2v241, partial [Hermanssonia centrifuga]